MPTNKPTKMLVNNTGAALHPFEKQIIDAIDTGILPEDIADIFTLTIRVEGDVTKGILTWA